MPVNAVSRFLNDRQIRCGRMLVAVSGGADSVALLRALDELSRVHELELVIAHFDHALRPESVEDARWVELLAKTLGTPCRSGRRTSAAVSDNGVHAVEVNQSEESARRARYDFLTRAAVETECRWLAVAHTADDQTETILHHLLRGSGLKGLSGIPETRELNPSVTLVRPLLEVRRAEILEFLESRQQTFLTDATNASSRFTRNRIRNELLPLLRAQFNCRVDEALSRLGQHSRQTQQLIEELADSLLQCAELEDNSTGLRLNRQILSTSSPVLLREMFSRVWQGRNWSRQAMTAAHYDQLARMLHSGSPSRLSLPDGVEALVRGNLFELRRVPVA